MNSEMDIKKIKHKVYLTYFQDGLWDIALGLFLLVWGVTVWIDLPWLPGGAFVVLFWLTLGLKQKITYPRIGYVRPSEHRKRTLIIMIGGVVVLIAVIALLPIVNRGGTQVLRDYFEIFLNTSMAIALALIGYWWGVIRWYFYAALTFMFVTFYQWLGLSYKWSFFIPGAVALVFGLVILTKFTRRYSEVSWDNTDEN